MGVQSPSTLPTHPTMGGWNVSSYSFQDILAPFLILRPLPLFYRFARHLLFVFGFILLLIFKMRRFIAV